LNAAAENKRCDYRTIGHYSFNNCQ